MATQSASQRRKNRKIEYNVFMKDCPSRKLLDTIGSKWVTLVLTTLSGRTLRYSQIREEIAGISEKMLTQTLRNLERDGLALREVTASIPPRVDYRLTPLGESLVTPIMALRSWAENNMGAIETAQQRYDAEESGTV
ncbi:MULTISPECIES: helix-turn-helix domain-containing protein [unclassified Corynebacterium]|uniref:winged helix-turn-helix transcriptional regulator n=1 Tax=unclassified Corynebacterium TaxID=2624378 RepID=UPI001EF4C8A0|nr:MULTISPECIES: helix-turn-helix domain-containing protein [unclassified Corynebacterium]MCG7259417.1 helix-turn-helix transcriptional regulator [Corynebacterium sp. ACRQK]MCG7263628.1 helix-turn-helix transcriptional regulator [Corynebacterium sp. ACRQL]